MGEPGWAGRIEVGDATYCAGPVDYRTLEEILADKVVVRVVPGTYPVPLVGGAYALNVPMCVAFRDGSGLATSAGGSWAAVDHETWDGFDYAHARWVQPLEGDAPGTRPARCGSRVWSGAAARSRRRSTSPTAT